MKIYAPNTQANGVYASVIFVDGVGETDNPRLIEWFKSHGYRLENCEPTRAETWEVGGNELIEEPDEPDFENMTPNDLREWMKSNGFGMKIKNIRSKEKLLEIIRG